MARRTHAESLQTRNEILEAAIDCFQEKGVTQASLEDIAKHAGYTRGAVYHHFKNKAEIVIELLESVQMPFEDILQAAHKKEPDAPLEALQKISNEILYSHLSDQRRTRIHSILYHHCEWTAELDPVFQHMLTIKQSCLTATYRFFDSAAQKGHLRPDLSPGKAAYYLQCFCLGIYWRSLLNPAQETNFKDVCLALDIYFQGLKAS